MSVAGYMHIAMELWGFFFCIFASICIYISKGSIGKSGRFLITLSSLCSLLLLADSFAWLCRGYPGMTGNVIVHISNFLVFAINNFMLLIYTKFLISIMGPSSDKNRIWITTVRILVAVSLCLLIISQFNNMYYYFDSSNFYHRGRWFILSQAFGIVGTVIDIVMLIINRKYVSKIDFVSFMTYLLLPFVALIIQTKFYGISFLNIAITVSVLWLYISLLIKESKKMRFQTFELEAQVKQIAEQDHQISDMQRRVILSQIQPHFLYNTLNTIYFLCEKDSSKAQEAIAGFSDYLRTNLDSLKCTTTVSFEAELKHVKNYIKLEQMRFGEELCVSYDIKEMGFRLPPLSIQPIVENAVKYGFSKADNSAHIRISSAKRDDFFEVVIEDNGPGFDQTREPEGERSHIGIENVRRRLELICKGELFIESIPDKGTKVTVKVPFYE